MNDQIETRAAYYVIELEDPKCTPQMRKRFEKWVTADPRHRRTFEAIRSVWRLARALRRIH